MHQQSTRPAEAVHSKGLHGWVHSNGEAALCAGDQLGKPATTLYQLALCPVKDVRAGQLPTERGNKILCMQ